MDENATSMALTSSRTPDELSLPLQVAGEKREHSRDDSLPYMAIMRIIAFMRIILFKDAGNPGDPKLVREHAKARAGALARALKERSAGLAHPPMRNLTPSHPEGQGRANGSRPVFRVPNNRFCSRLLPSL